MIEVTKYDLIRELLHLFLFPNKVLFKGGKVDILEQACASVKLSVNFGCVL